MKKINNFFAIMVSFFFVACSTNELFEEGGKAPVIPGAEPVDFVVVGNGNNGQGASYTFPVEVCFDKEDVAPQASQLTVEMTAAEKIMAEGNQPWFCTDEDIAAADSRVTFHYNYGTNTVTISGLVLDYKWNGKVYHLTSRYPIEVECRLSEVKEEKEPSYYSEKKANYSLLSNGFTMAKAATIMVAAEEYVEPEFKELKKKFTHVDYAIASYLNGMITIPCNNVASFVKVSTDDSEKDAAEVAYVVRNFFAVELPAMELNDKSNVINKVYNFSNTGIVVVEGYEIKVPFKNTEVSEILYEGVDYSNDAPKCRASVKTIRFTSDSTAEITFEGEEGEKIIVEVPASLTDKVVLKEIVRDFVHIAFRSNAVVSGSNIAATCDNELSIVKKYSDGSEDAPVNVKYTVVNNFTAEIPQLVVANDNFVGNPYEFNNGTAVVEGYNLNVKLANRVVSDIMFEGKNYKNEAPVCAVAVKNITFNSTEQATLTFESEEGEEVTATLPVKVVVAEAISGNILGVWATDSYTVQEAAQEGTYIHVLAENNGVYTMYSRRVGESSFTTTGMSAADAQALINSGRAAAYVWDGYKYILGTVSAKEREGYSDRYVLEYWLLDGRLAYRLGKNAETIGKPYRNPVRGQVEEANGVYNLTVDGSVYYFFGQN